MMLNFDASINFYRDVANITPVSRVLLRFGSRLFSYAVGFRNWLYDRTYLKAKRLPGPTISVGNIVVGGTGKSPFVVVLAKDFLARGFRPAIVTRGHGSQLARDESMVLLNGKVNIMPERTNRAAADEAMMQSQELDDVPVVVGASRLRAVRRFLKHSPQLAQTVTHWILDDGFQHRQIHRDIDVILLDSTSPWGNGHMLPLGPLREPLKSVKRGHFVIFTRSGEGLPSELALREVGACASAEVSFAPQRVDSPLLVHGKSLKPVTDPSLKVAIVAAIARPERFFGSVEQFGIVINEQYFLPDHCLFDANRLREIAIQNDAIVTTAKDYWRDTTIFSSLDIPVYVLPIHFDVDLRTLNRISHVLSQVSSSAQL